MLKPSGGSDVVKGAAQAGESRMVPGGRFRLYRRSRRQWSGEASLRNVRREPVQNLQRHPCGAIVAIFGGLSIRDSASHHVGTWDQYSHGPFGFLLWPYLRSRDRTRL